MSTIPEIRARLSGAGSPFKLVAGALELASVKTVPRAMPAAYVLAPKEATAANSHATGPVLQRSERDIMVVIVAQNLSDPKGGATGDQLENLKTFVRAQLIGFTPTDMEEFITHVGGEVAQAFEGTVWFEDTFSAPVYLRGIN